MRHLVFRRTTRFFAFLAVVSFVGCRPTGPASPAGTAKTAATSPTSRPISMISPVDFFSPEQKRLSQHLGWHTGCFQIEYSGPEAWLASNLEIWEHGKLQPHGGGLSASKAKTCEISISAYQDASQPNAWRVTRAQSFATGGGSSTSGTPYSRPKFERSSTRLAQIKGPVEMMHAEEVAVWALMAFQTDAKGHDNYHPEKSVAEQAKDADWALVLKVALDPPGVP